MENNEAYTTIYNAIAATDFSSEQLHALSGLLHQKFKQIRVVKQIQAASVLKIGVEVRVIKPISPKYLEGRIGTVKEFKSPTKIILEFQQPLGGKFGLMKSCAFPTSCLQVIEKKPTALVNFLGAGDA